MLIAAYTPMARLRGGPSGKVVVTSDSAVGAMMAPPTPCAARAASSQACVVAKPPSSEASENRRIPGDEDSASVQDVAGPAAEQQQAAEGERVGVDHPFQAGAGEAERLRDVGQGHVYDRRVEDHHQLRGGDDDQGQAELAVAVGGRAARLGRARCIRLRRGHDSPQLLGTEVRGQHDH
jgi:hypothetical protein